MFLFQIKFVHYFLIIIHFTVFPLAVKSINYLGVGVCGLSLLLHSHMIYLAYLLFYFLSSTGIIWHLGGGDTLILF